MPSLIVTSVIQVFTTILYFKAIKHSDLSVTVPMVTFTPLFLLVTSPIILGEFPGPLGLAGILLIVMGSYMLNIKQRSKGYMAPFRALLTEQGPRYMLIVAVLWSISSSIDKIGVLSSSPGFWVLSVNVLITILISPIVVVHSKRRGMVRENIRIMVAVGLVGGIYMLFQNIAITLTLVVFVSSIKRLSVIFSVLLGWAIFKEKCIRERLLGALVMVLGAILIALG
jgi:drug/metabolite transporter (DMT)-like permease